MFERSAVCLLLATTLFAQTKAVPKAGRSVVLTWTASTTAGVDYIAYRAVGTCSAASNFAKINTAPITAVTYTDTGVADGTYCYYVTAHHAAAIPTESVASNKAETVVQSQPAPPTNLIVNPATASLAVNEQQQFTAVRGTDSVNASWSIDPADVGTISPTGLYTAPGSIKGNNVDVQVIAHEAGEQASAAVTVRKK